MKIAKNRSCTVALATLCAALTNCGGGNKTAATAASPSPAVSATVAASSGPSATPIACKASDAVLPQTSRYHILYSFTGGADGAEPSGHLLSAAGGLVGTTNEGGTGHYGTVFSVDPASSSERVLYSFKGGSDGARPQALLEHGGAYFGTTTNPYDYRAGASGITMNAGTVFSLSASGGERVLYSFRGRSEDHVAGEGKHRGVELEADAAHPWAGMTEADGKFYGTSKAGGSHNAGTVFVVTPDGKERILYSFTGRPGEGEEDETVAKPESDSSDEAAEIQRPVKTVKHSKHAKNRAKKRAKKAAAGRTVPDGANPTSALNDVGGTLYGTTMYGGADGYGTVFSVSQTGNERVLYSFKGGEDGANPDAGLLDMDGTLYGTTPYGGTEGFGTVFAISTAGKARTVYNFRSGIDGSHPSGALIDVNDQLVGTTANGGLNSDPGDGVVFAVTPMGDERVLYGFNGGLDGSHPTGNLVAVNGVLYGTTTNGGGNCNAGTVFALTP